jgi:hypothetical protein
MTDIEALDEWAPRYNHITELQKELDIDESEVTAFIHATLPVMRAIVKDHEQWSKPKTNYAAGDTIPWLVL